MFYSIAYPLSQSPHGGVYTPLDESYIEYQKLMNERIENQRREFEEKRRKEQDREFRNFWRRFDPFFDDRPPPQDFEYEDVDEDYPEILTRIDSFSAISSIPYNGSLIVTNLFNQKNEYQTLLPIDLSKFHNGGWLYLNKAPIELDTFQFTFQFFDAEGNIFETTTDPIIITP